MAKLSYSITYTPSLEGLGAEEKGIDFLCVDGKIHVRLRDYDHPETIRGFVDKLTFVVTYLINAESGSMGDMTAEGFISEFCSHSADFTSLSQAVGSLLHEPRYKGIQVSKAYRKKNKGPTAGPLGSISKGAAPLVDGSLYGDLAYFLEEMRLDLYSFLFDDAYSIQIQERAEEASYAKFANKLNRKVLKSRGDFEYVSLW